MIAISNIFSVVKKVIYMGFYNPYRFVSRCPFISMGRSKLGRSFFVDLRSPRNTLAFKAGDDCILMQRNIFESDSGLITIGNRTFINSGTNIICRNSISIGDDVTIAWGCTIYDHDSHSLDYRDRIADQLQQLEDWDGGGFGHNKNWESVNSSPITIGNYAWLGFDAVVLKGVSIGEGAIIGARAVVATDIPAWAIAVGNPARVVRMIPLEQRRP